MLTDSCAGLSPIVRLIKKGVFPVVQIFIPILLLLFGVIDLGKAVIASDEKEIKAAQGRLIKRVIYAVVIFFIVVIVRAVMNLVAGVVADGSTGTNANLWAACWDSIK